jgi:hypothetical protein
MRHDIRTCGCGQQFALPSLMSRQATCVSCDRKAAVALMDARRGETMPAGWRAFPIAIGAKGARAYVGDVCATGVARVEPLRVPMAEWQDRARDDLRERKAAQVAEPDPNVVDGVRWPSEERSRWEWAKVDGWMLAAFSPGGTAPNYKWIAQKPSAGGFEAHVEGLAPTLLDARRAAIAAMRAHEAKQTADRFATLPAAPKTFEEAMGLMREGWVMRHAGGTKRRIVDGNEEANESGYWRQATHLTGMCTSGLPGNFTGNYAPTRPE